MCAKQFTPHVLFIYLFPSDFWENTWRLALSIPSIHGIPNIKRFVCGVALCVCVSWVGWAKWLSNYVRVWDNSVGFSLHSCLFFDCQGWREANTHTHTNNTLLFHSQHHTEPIFISLPFLSSCLYNNLSVSCGPILLLLCLISSLFLSLPLFHIPLYPSLFPLHHHSFPNL